MAERFNIPLHQVFDSNGDPLSGAKLSFFVSGTSTPLDTYSDNALSVANANPVVADSAGRFGDIFLQSADYKVILKTSADVTIWTADPVHGGSPNPLFSSISVKSGNYTVVAGDNGKLIPVTASATITITASATLGSNFRCGIVNAGSGVVTVARSSADTFDAGQTSVKLAPGQGIFVQPDGTSKLYTVGRDGRGKGADIASASTLPLGEDGHYFHVTGTTTITAIEARPTGWEVILEFDAALQITHNATSMIMPGATNFITKAGDILSFVSESDAGNWRCISVMRNGLVEDTAPDVLADFVPIFDTSALADKKVLPRNLGVVLLDKSGTATTIASSTAETSLYTKVIPGNAMGANGSLRLTIRGTYSNNSGVARTFTLRIKFGGATVYDDVSPSIATSALIRQFCLQYMIYNKNSVSAQDGSGFFNIANVAATTQGFGDFATASLIDALIGHTGGTTNTAVDQTLDVTIQHSNADTTIIKIYAALELL